MSAIAGIIHFDGRPVEPGLVEGMTAAMRHRGPDGIAHWRNGSVALGQCMLRTTPESLEESQPLANEDASLVLVMDGRVDNGEELRRELLARGAKLRDRSDAELVLGAFEAWGHDCFERINGDFALAIWNARDRTLFCARDRLGNKPFHYHWDGRTFAFASELKPTLDLPWVTREPNEGMLAEFLAAQWHARDETLWQGIHRLIAAHRMVVTAAGPRTHCYWEPDLWQTLPCREDAEYVEHYRELLFDCVRRSARTLRPLACEVSGGLDSSAVFAVAERLRREGRLPAPAIHGYTLAFGKADGDANELLHARAVGAHLGTSLHEVSPSLFDLDGFAKLAREQHDFPGFPNAAMFAGIRERAASDGCRVLLTGEGGDEWLCGTPAFYAEQLASRDWRQLRESFRADASDLGRAQAIRRFARHGVFASLPTRWQDRLRGWRQVLRNDRAEQAYWLSPAMRARLEERRASFIRPPARIHRIGQRALLDSLHDPFSGWAMEQSERLAARIGIEPRHPLRDHRLVQFAFATPERLRLRGDQNKRLHVQALRGLLPDSVLERTDKAEFSIVFRHHLNALHDGLADALQARRGDWLDRAGVERLCGLQRARPELAWPLWVLWSVWACDSMRW